MLYVGKEAIMCQVVGSTHNFIAMGYTLCKFQVVPLTHGSVYPHNRLAIAWCRRGRHTSSPPLTLYHVCSMVSMQMHVMCVSPACMCDLFFAPPGSPFFSFGGEAFEGRSYKLHLCIECSVGPTLHFGTSVGHFMSREDLQT